MQKPVGYCVLNKYDFFVTFTYDSISRTFPSESVSWSVDEKVGHKHFQIFTVSLTFFVLSEGVFLKVNILREKL